MSWSSSPLPRYQGCVSHILNHCKCRKAAFNQHCKNLFKSKCLAPLKKNRKGRKLIWIKNKDRKYLYLDLQNGFQWKKKKNKPLLVTTTALCSHMSIFLGLSSALDHPPNLSDWLEFSPAVGKEQRLRPEYVYLANEPRKENAAVLRQQHRPPGRCRESENLFSIWMLCTYVTDELGLRSLSQLHFQ